MLDGFAYRVHEPERLANCRGWFLDMRAFGVDMCKQIVARWLWCDERRVDGGVDFLAYLRLYDGDLRGVCTELV
jgi:hypothetical protein